MEILHFQAQSYLQKHSLGLESNSSGENFHDEGIRNDPVRRVSRKTVLHIFAIMGFHNPVVALNPVVLKPEKTH